MTARMREPIWPTAGWQTAGASATDLLAKHGLPPVDADDAPFGEVVYLSAELETEAELN